MKLWALIPLFLLMAGCGSATDTPEAAVARYLQAAIEHDTETMREMLVEAEREHIKDLPDNFDKAPATDTGFEVGEAKINGDTATVPVTFTANGEDLFENTYTCKKEQGQWRVSLVASRD